MEVLAGVRKACLLALLVVVAAGWLRAGADGSVVDEYQVKAAFLFNFAKFVEWPAQAPNASSDAIALCVFGKNPFGTALDGIAGKSIGNRKFVVREVSGAQQANKCHILFVAGSDRKRIRALLEEVKTSSMLTVGETEDFIGDGGIVSFRLKDARVHFEIDDAAAERAGLHISSKLLSLADSAKK